MAISKRIIITALIMVLVVFHIIFSMNIFLFIGYNLCDNTLLLISYVCIMLAIGAFITWLILKAPIE